MVLKDTAGNSVANPTCTAADPVTLQVAANCSSVVGRRLGAQQIVVSGGGVTANVAVKVIPQRLPLATSGVSLSLNAVVTSAGNVQMWGYNSGAGPLGQGQTFQTLQMSALPLTVKSENGTGQLSNIVAAAVGKETALALSEDGE